MLRIALYHNLPSGGAKRAVREWTRRLASSHSIDVYTLSTADHAFCDIRPFVQKHQIVDFSLRRKFTSPWGRLNWLQRWRDLGELTRTSRLMAAEINHGGYDVVFANPCLYTYIPILVRFLQIPVVYYLHEPFGPTVAHEFQRPYLKKQNKWRELSRRFDPFFALYTRRLENSRITSLGKTTRILANSQFTQQCMKREYGLEPPVCHYGVDFESFHPRHDVQRENCVISVGELTPRKGFDFLVESLAYVPVDKRPVLRLACNWVSLDEKHYVEELAARNGIRLHILVNLRTEELVLEYNKAQICVYSPVSEPFGLVPLEAMACGTPVIGVAEGGVRETIRHGETGLQTDRDPKQFADALLKLLADPLLAAELGRRGVEYVRQEWSWDRSATGLEKHLEEVARGGALMTDHIPSALQEDIV
jgi:glycosyltransferase involved in cell wall biosynthesis